MRNRPSCLAGGLSLREQMLVGLRPNRPYALDVYVNRALLPNGAPRFFCNNNVSHLERLNPAMPRHFRFFLAILALLAAMAVSTALGAKVMDWSHPD